MNKIAKIIEKGTRQKAELVFNYDKNEVNVCLNCKKPECDDCIGRKGNGRENKTSIEYNGKSYSLTELARMRKISIPTMKRRIDLYGVEFAMSKYSFYRDWRKACDTEAK